MAKKPAKKTASRKPASPSKSKKSAAPAKKNIDLFASVETIEQLSSTIKLELEAFDQKRVKSAARRARKALQELRKLCGTTRKDIMETLKQMKEQ